MQPPAIGVRQADELGRRILSLYGKAYGPNSVKKTRLDGCIQAWAREPIGKSSQANPISHSSTGTWREGFQFVGVENGSLGEDLS